jgi:cell division septal protein FtsQ
MIYFLYKILVVSLPIGKAHVSYSMEVAEYRKKEIGKIFKETGIDDLNELKNLIESLPWVRSVHLRRNILSRLNIIVTPRVPVVRIADKDGKVIDKEGFIFIDDKADSLPMVKISKAITSEEIEQALGIFKILKEFNVDKVHITGGGVRTKISGFEVIWGNDEFVRKYEILRVILKDNIGEFKGKIDFRFKNMVVLRR